MRYSVQPRDRIFVKGYGFLSFAKYMGKNIGKNVSNFRGKYSQNLLIMLSNLQQILNIQIQIYNSRRKTENY